MEGTRTFGCHATSTPVRTCTRRGCNTPVKKRTAKYCSVTCCSIDPERHERLRVQARRTGRRNVIPLARQLRFDLPQGAPNPEAQLEMICAGREDAPQIMARLTG